MPMLSAQERLIRTLRLATRALRSMHDHSTVQIRVRGGFCLQLDNRRRTSPQKRQYLASGALAIAVRVSYNPCPWCEDPGIAHQEELWHMTLARFDSKWE